MGGWVGVHVCVSVCASVCVRVCVCACVRMYVCVVCMRVCARVRAYIHMATLHRGVCVHIYICIHSTTSALHPPMSWALVEVSKTVLYSPQPIKRAISSLIFQSK